MYAATQLQAGWRGMLGRLKYDKYRTKVMKARQRENATRRIQANYRMHLGWKEAMGRKQVNSARYLQRIFRGHIGRDKAAQRRAYLEHQKLCNRMATKIQSTFRMHEGRLKYLRRRILELAAAQIQRIWRGERDIDLEPFFFVAQVFLFAF